MMECCSSCEESNCDLYYCKDCENNECSSAQAGEFLCETCVGIHIKKGHDIRSLKDQVPTICKIHRMLHVNYCKTCDLTFCAECLQEHNQHEVGILENRAREVKKDVFEVLSQLELQEKPVRRKKESFDKMEDQYNKERAKLKTMVEEKVGELKQKLFEAIDINSATIAHETEMLSNLVDDIQKFKQDCGNVLQLPQNSLIHEHQLVKRKVKELRERYEKAERKHCSVESTEADGFGNLEQGFREINERTKLVLKAIMTDKFSCSKEELVSSIETDPNCAKFPETVKPNPNEEPNFVVELVSRDKSDQMQQNELEKERKEQKHKLFRYPYEVYCTNKELVVNEMKKVGQGEANFERKLQRKFSGEISNFFVLCSTSGTTQLIVLDKFHQDNGKYFIINIVNGSISNVDVGHHKWVDGRLKLVCPYMLDNEEHWCYWKLYETYMQKVILSHQMSFVEYSRLPPKLLSWGYQDQFCLLTSENWIVYINTARRQYDVISPAPLQVASIDHVTVCEQLLFVWSKKSRCIVLMEKEASGQWKVDRKVNWDDPTQELSLSPFSRSARRIKLIPALRVKQNTDHSDGELKYVYCCEEA